MAVTFFKVFIESPILTSLSIHDLIKKDRIYAVYIVPSPFNIVIVFLFVFCFILVILLIISCNLWIVT